jgi:hypothetical protein
MVRPEPLMLLQTLAYFLASFGMKQLANHAYSLLLLLLLPPAEPPLLEHLPHGAA